MCHPKTMLKIGLIIALPLAIAAAAVPQFRAAIVGAVPLLVFALCPISMLVCMWGLKDGGAKSTCTTQESPPPARPQRGGTAA